MLLLCVKVNISQTLLQELLAYMFSVLLLITYTLVVQLNITLFEVSPHPPNRIVFKTSYLCPRVLNEFPDS